MANCNNCVKQDDCCSARKMSGYCGGYSPAMVTNREYFFGDKMIADTVMLLTYDNHPRQECRDFKQKLRRMRPDELRKWLEEPKDRQFNW
ncbi:MAG: hypothetical protein KH304_10710 [Clostridium sp.]|uniref:hypothetical protein n=1 Tax=Clostridia TaxID=186801 RepID=UPI000A740D0B|nr:MULTISPECIES: hypothetical protein [Clostridia]MBS6764031.1 hypothetical protein [Clostridium sp.]